MAFHRQQQALAKLSLGSAGSALALAFLLAGTIVVAAEERWPSNAASRKPTASPQFDGPITRLLPGAPIKAPVFFADDTGSSEAKVKQASWHRYGYPSYAYYRGYGGWYGPWYGRGAYGYYGAPYGGYWSGLNRPYGYGPYGYSPYWYGTVSPYAYGLPYYYGSGAYPLYTGSYYPYYALYGSPYYTALYYPSLMGPAVNAYPPYAVGGYGGCCYW